ncbi:tRNA pseudouridine synthase Pus10-like [Oscarella lobularis]|uniref:tRNA pseudouridine synthase Pus10-like n=1 Tax=Oscarella lobularis TaxID=121494 RepID=UPI003313F019
MDVCLRCVLRIGGITDYGAYATAARKSADTVEEIVQEAKKPKTTNDCSETCPSCLGLLQDETLTEIASKINEHVQGKDYDYDSFTLAVYLPLSLLVRQHSLLLTKSSDAVKKDEIVVSTKDAVRWSLGPMLEELLNAPYKPHSDLLIAVYIVHPDCSRDLEFLAPYSKSKSVDGLTIGAVELGLKSIADHEFKQMFPCPPICPQVPCYVEEISCSYSSVYIAGRYNKYSRTLSQTPWVLDGMRKTESSIQEMICDKLQARLKASGVKFSSSGREDVDVRMLGSGRPFVAEFVDPHRSKVSQQELCVLQKEINESTDAVAVRDLQLIKKEETSQLKEGEDAKRKTYSALIWSETPVTESDLAMLSGLKDVTLLQRTPLRVLHRRTLFTRPRTIFSMSATPAQGDDHHFKLTLTTQAGTYIKEFVHGDMGRTQPNLKTLLNGRDVDILLLDVQSIDINWPPPIENDQVKDHSF